MRLCLEKYHLPSSDNNATSLACLYNVQHGGQQVLPDTTKQASSPKPVMERHGCSKPPGTFPDPMEASDSPLQHAQVPVAHRDVIQEHSNLHADFVILAHCDAHVEFPIQHGCFNADTLCLHHQIKKALALHAQRKEGKVIWLEEVSAN